MKILYAVTSLEGELLRHGLSKKDAKAYARTRGLDCQVQATCTLCGWNCHKTPVWAYVDEQTRHHRLIHDRGVTA